MLCRDAEGGKLSCERRAHSSNYLWANQFLGDRVVNVNSDGGSAAKSISRNSRNLA